MAGRAAPAATSGPGCTTDRAHRSSARGGGHRSPTPTDYCPGGNAGDKGNGARGLHHGKLCEGIERLIFPPGAANALQPPATRPAI